jgi:DNA-binding CsgD family transcriptional regulator
VIRYEQRTAHMQRGPEGRLFDEPDDELGARNWGAVERVASDRLGCGCSLPPLDGLAATLAMALDDLPGGMIVLDADGRAVHLNRAAQAIVGRRDGISIDRSSAIVLASPDATRQLADLLHGVRDGGIAGGVAGGAAGGTVRVPRRHGRAAYTLVVSAPAHRHDGRDDGAAGGADARGAMVLIHDPDRRLQAPPALLRRVFGLTRREAELVGALVDGIGTSGFALQAGISLNTVRFHLKSVYAKLAVRGQAELLRTVLTVVAVLGGERHAALWRAGASRAGRERQIRQHP